MAAPDLDLYEEHRPSAGLGGVVRCTWSRGIAGPRKQATITPDGCVDLVAMPGGGVSVAGPDTGPKVAELGRGVVVGLRFRIGVAGSVLGIAASALRDQRVPLVELWSDEGRRLEERLGLEGSATARRKLLEEAVRGRVHGLDGPDALVVAAANRLEAGECRVRELGHHFGVSERQLRRRFDAAIGYGPKTLERVLRFRRLLAAFERSGAAELSHLAHSAGYADQAHMTRECVELAGATPRTLRDRSSSVARAQHGPPSA